MRIRELTRYLLILLLVFSISGCGIGAKYRIIKKGNGIKIEAPSKTLRVGEKFTYGIEWLGLDVGTATLSVEEITQMNGRKVYHILATANTTPAISKVYKVEDEISTYLDVEGLYPVRFEKKQREGSYRSDEYTDFDQEKGKAIYFSRLNRSKKVFDIPEKVQDPLSCMYYFRLQEADVGGSIFANLNVDEKNYLLETKVHNKGFINIKGVGEWEAFMVEPLPWFQGKIKRKAKATMWFSADEKRIPLLVKTSSIPLVGSVTISLQKIEYKK
ncbi:MAG: DUF3108 domain-containing protein [Candidatus Omnitrophica bacterium]|nr:DUF3108 domain-containing protein [Candidatus Omnitrophota bacterium]MBU1853815.1 DUF3108 domain-containing protein [Candidatus Omnitrophota bacterium]